MDPQFDVDTDKDELDALDGERKLVVVWLEGDDVILMFTIGGGNAILFNSCVVRELLAFL